ncbi:MAG: alpha/beta hydrolase [Elusimicrobiota bacterium]|jgi:hypothetical protein
MRRPFLPLLLAFAGCTNVFLQPDRADYLPKSGDMPWERVSFTSRDGTPLAGLWLPAAKVPSKGVIVHFHGNAENMTTHFLYVRWLAEEGWDVLAFDYRGYGASGGEKALRGSVQDGAAALAYARGKAAGKPLIVFGQSLGGALALASLSVDGGENVRAVVLDSTFSSYRRVAREKLSRLRLTWPLQWPLSLALISDRWAPTKLAARRRPVPLLMLHARGDPVVPYAEGRRLYDRAAGPKEFWDVPGRGHTEAFSRYRAEFRPRLLNFLNDSLKR